MRRDPFAFTIIIILAVAIGTATAQGLSPEQAVQRVTTSNGLRVRLFASEPEIRQPIFVKCDDRGRLWTIQYLQYPNPAGLKRVSVDRWSRTVYDRIPKPPPYGPAGADRITILEDTDGDGRADRVKDFVTGLNLVTGVAFGHGGVFVLNVPYLLFYPDRDRDDVPDGAPEVLLTGFGMEDAQAMANHLTWGPDGWLYGVNGSTTTCNIRGVEFQQGAWRYHPKKHAFELFCEGGANCYGLTFDANGEMFYSTNGGPFVHASQGAYFYKSFGKHGPLHNLHAYHFFPELERDQVPGGPPTGGTIYLSNELGEKLRGKFIAGNFLGQSVSWWDVNPAGGTVRATYGGKLLDAHDPWFGPTDVCSGPDGALYVSDFHDARTAHPDPDANWDRSNGRIYKIEPKNTSPSEPIDVTSLSSDALVDLFSHQNRWYADRARCELAHREDRNIVDRLRKMALQESDSQAALDGLWTLHQIAGIDDALAVKLLRHPHDYVRYWAVRLLGDRKQVTSEVGETLVKLAAGERSRVVRGQLAASAKRLAGSQGLPIVEQLLSHPMEEVDERETWLTWWAIEDKSLSDSDRLNTFFGSAKAWAIPAIRANTGRLIRRYAAEGTVESYGSCLTLLESAPREHMDFAIDHLRKGLAERSVGLHGIGQGGLYATHASEPGAAAPNTERRFAPLTDDLKNWVADRWLEAPSDLNRLETAVRANVDGANLVLTGAALMEEDSPQLRIPLLKLMREFPLTGDAAQQLLAQLAAPHNDELTIAILDVLAKTDDASIFVELIDRYKLFSPIAQDRVRTILFGRRASAIRFLSAVEEGRILAEDVPVEDLRRLAFLKNDRIDALVRKHWGAVGPGTSEEKLATMRRFNNDLRAGAGDIQAGKSLYAKHCGNCHTLHGEGEKIGPDLTTANRGDRDALLANVVDPSAVIKREYINYVVVTISGQVVTGLMADRDNAAVTILDAENRRVRVPLDEVETIQEANTSLMPERILEQLSGQQIRDLFAYLQKQ